MLRLMTATRKRWSDFKLEARKYDTTTQHPAQLAVKTNTITYWGSKRKGSRWHARIVWDPNTGIVVLEGNTRKGARSELESYHFLSTLLPFGRKKPQPLNPPVDHT